VEDIFVELFRQLFRLGYRKSAKKVRAEIRTVEKLGDARYLKTDYMMSFVVEQKEDKWD